MATSMAVADPLSLLATAAAGSATLSPQEAWERVLARDPSAVFVYAVRTTGIYCRPSCSSRRPRPENIAFFQTVEDARTAGFRPCLRCTPDGPQDEAVIADRLSRHLRDNLDRAVPLSELARVAQRTPANTQRLFTRVLGVSPRAWQRQLRADAFRGELSQPQARITDAIYNAGFSSPSRAHAAASLGMEARQYRAGGRDQRITYTTAACPLGLVLVASTGRGLCALFLGDPNDEEVLALELRTRFPLAEIVRTLDTEFARELTVVQAAMTEHAAALDLPLDLRATAFQARVWEALRAIPRGETRTYSQVAVAIGAPGAVRAVASACAANHVSLLVPCHRVIGSNGKLTGYRWGVERKRQLLALEKKTSQPLEEVQPSSLHGKPARTLP